MPSLMIERQARIANTPAYKIPCRVSTTAALPSLADLLTIDGVTLVAGDRVLVRHQSNALENGIYVAGVAFWERASDANEQRDLVNGSKVLVTSGTLWARSEFRLLATDPVTPGTTAQTWEEVSSEQSGSAATSAAAAAASASAAAGSASSASSSASAASTSATNAAASAAEAAAEIGRRTGTSTSSVEVGTGGKVFTTQPGKDFGVLRHLLVTSAGSGARMSGIVFAYDSNTGALTIIVEAASGSGTHADWTIRIDGERGPEGPDGPPGPDGPTGPAGDAATDVNTQTANYTLVLADAGRTVEMDLAGANTLTIPPNSSVAFPVGTIVNFTQKGAGQTTITPGSGVTLRSRAGLKTAGQWAMGTLYKRATDEWVVGGDVVV